MPVKGEKRGPYKPVATAKRVKYIHARLEGKPPREAGLAAGTTRRRTIADFENSKLWSAYVGQRLAVAGVDVNKVAEKLAAGLEATVVESFCTKDGTLVQTAPMVDFPTRQKYLTTAIDLLEMGSKARGNIVIGAGAGGVTVNVLNVKEKFSAVSDDELTEKLQKMQIGVLDVSGLASAKAET